MLLKLTISNFAIIRHMCFEPVAGLNIITGETGAGKSILLDALELILGSRADIKTRSEWGDKTVIEGEFALDAGRYEALFGEMDIDFEETTLIRREITASGKSRTFINDTPVSLQQLRTLGSMLVSIHSQHENTQLNDREYQFSLLDTYAGTLGLLGEYRTQLHRLKENEAALNALKKAQDTMLREKDYISFLLSEFEKADLKDNEEESLEKELLVLSNAEQMTMLSAQLEDTLTESEQSVVNTLQQLRNRFRTLEDIHPVVRDISVRLQSVLAELKDLSAEASSMKEAVSADPGRLETVNERLSQIQHLKRKHGVTEFAALMKVYESLADQMTGMGRTDARIEELEKENRALNTELKKRAAVLHGKRLESVAGLKLEIEQRLRSLEMPNASIEFELLPAEEPNEMGMSQLNIRFTANLGMPLQALSKVASGGELSRLALCIRSIEASRKKLNTLIFDEIDTGVSGRVADTIGKMFRQISSGHQVIAITHLPQVAGYGEAHFLVGKSEMENRTVSSLQKLSQNERVEELAKMLSGNRSTEIAKKNARELLKV